MLSKLSLISLNELKFMTPRVLVYSGVAYLAVRAVRFAVNQTARLVGLDDTNRS